LIVGTAFAVVCQVASTGTGFIMQWQAIVDFDGTISRQDTTDQILERFAEPAWRAIEQDWLDGAIGSRECMRRQVELLRVSPAELDAFIAGIEIDWGFSAFVRVCARHDIPVTVVSDGLDRTIRSVLTRAGLGALPVVANHLASAGGDRWRLSSPHAASSGACSSGTCKCAVADSLHRPLTLLVGDGKSDHCVAGQADLVFAKAGLLAHCRENGLPHHPFSTFSQAVRLLEELLGADAAVAARHNTKDMIDG
jgi:2,3-diketo-5-methylthio-1-phosphopentane phosphatase